MTGHDDTEACAAVQGYLVTEFPGGDMWDERDADRSAHTWGVEERHVQLLLTVSFEFLRDQPAGAIRGRLRDWHVADELRASGSTRRVVVTNDGVQVVVRCLRA